MANNYKLGPLPWSRDTLIKAHWVNWVGALENIKEHPGFAAQEGLDDVQRTLDVFLDNCDDFWLTVTNFKTSVVQQPGFFWRSNREKVEQWERTLRKHIFSVTSSALALVDASRRVSIKFPIHGYDEQKNSVFVQSELHLFMQGLRNFFTHKYLLTPSWQIRLTKNNKVTQLVLNQDKLKRFDGWSPLARAFIEKSRFGVDVEAAISSYRKLVEDFHNWYRQNFLATYSHQISEYSAYEKILKGEAWKLHWKRLLDYGIANNLNPYTYLDQHLTHDEIKRASALPHGSKEQIDLMISMADEFEICDDEIRGMVYKLFSLAVESRRQKLARGLVGVIGAAVIALLYFVSRRFQHYGRRSSTMFKPRRQ